MAREKLKLTLKISAILVAFVATTILIAGALAGWFDNPKNVKLEPEYYNSAAETTLDVETFNQMLADQKSFVLITYLPTCTNDIISFLKTYSESRQISYFYLNWSDSRETALKSIIKFSPSVAIIKNGRPVSFLDADSDADIEKYSSFDAFSAWLDEYIVL